MAGTEDGLSQSSNAGAQWVGTPSFAGSFVGSVAFSTAGGPVDAASFTSIYSSPDDGVTWNFAGNAPCGVGTIAVDPAAPTTLYISNGNSTLYFYPGCAAKSTDGGVTWTTLSGLAFNYAVYGIVVDPKSPATLYAATDVGLSKSTNGGTTWAAINILGYINPFVTGVAIDPAQPAVVYAIVYDDLYKSTNGGGAWTLLSAAPIGVSSVALAPSKPSVVYAGTYGEGVYVSSNAGSAWSPAGLAGDFVEGVAVDPSKPSVVYASVPVYTDAFVAKINAAGSTLNYSTCLGGTGPDYGNGVAVDASGNAFVTGQTSSLNFPSTPAAFQPANVSGQTTGFVTEISGQTAACSYTALPASSFFYSFGGLGNFSVVAPSGCAWTATPSASWISVTNGGGPGVGTLEISVAANNGASRKGSIAVAGATIAITQAATGCTYSLSNYNPTFPQTGGPLSIDVTAATGCPWVVTNVPLWLTVSSGASGAGNGRVTLQAAANPFPGTRIE